MKIVRKTRKIRLSLIVLLLRIRLSIRNDCSKSTTLAVLIGRDAPALARVLGGLCTLEACATLPEAVRAAARELFPGAGEPSRLPPPESAEARGAIRGAEALARRGGCGYVGTEHLLGALALDPGSRARRVLVSLEVSIPAIKKELECYISPARQRRRKRGKTADAACSFCGKPRADSLRLIAGPGVYICAECIGLCNEILAADEPGA